jgi:N-acetylglucosaminyldiphosphoundecaprenol N-acetyl-beta-D-mannosaminyltransferase
MTEWYRSSTAYKEAVAASDICTIDGIGIALAIYRQYARVAPRLTGVGVVQCMIEMIKNTGQSLIIVGATDESRKAAERTLAGMGVTVCDGCSPTVSMYGDMDPELDVRIPDDSIVLVALGMPKQEFWIRRRMLSGPEQRCVYFGIGGVIDYLSGSAIFAPTPIRWAGLEWLFRLAFEPRKRWRRQFTTLPQFFVREIIAIW